MSDTEQPRITKDPKKVAAGKKLAFLRAEKRRLEQEKMVKLERQLEDPKLSMAVVGAVAAVIIVGLCSYRCWKRSVSMKEEKDDARQHLPDQRKRLQGGISSR